MSGSTRPPRVNSPVVLLLAALLTVAACSSSEETASDQAGDGARTAAPARPDKTTPAPKPPPPPPETGRCRNLNFADIGSFSNQSKELACGDAHTAYTFAVETLPDEVAFDGVDIHNDAVQTAAAQVCNTSFPAFIGGDAPTRALARLTVTYFLPEQGDFDRGAYWVRCDVVALQSAQMLAPLPRDVEGILDDEGALSKLGVCSNGEPGAQGSALVMCTEPHTYRALSALGLGDDNAAYPGDDTAKSTGEQCEEVVGDVLGAEGGFTYSWTYPSAADWAGGQRFGYCWNQTSN